MPFQPPGVSPGRLAGTARGREVAEGTPGHAPVEAATPVGRGDAPEAARASDEALGSPEGLADPAREVEARRRGAGSEQGTRAEASSSPERARRAVPAVEVN